MRNLRFVRENMSGFKHEKFGVPGGHLESVFVRPTQCNV